MNPRRQEVTPNRHAQWRCPCGARYGLRVTRTEHDENGQPVRIRICTNCGEPMATQEQPIPLSSFYARASTHVENNLRSEKRKPRTCKWCGGTYTYGSFSRHVKTATHNASLKHRYTDSYRKKARERHYRLRTVEDWVAA